jgi:hypothetical protein
MINLRNLRQLVCDGNEITNVPSSIISMENLRLITAKNTWLLPQFAKDECSTKPQVIQIDRSYFHFDLFIEITRVTYCSIK